ncbi:hypothetical protein B0H13DRAFT_2005809 [Mycena leptocephala]|nr:hypothetical protein B0H13DRAFT_2005809 [Mycena leptocephala]
MASYICGIIGYVVSILHHLFFMLLPATKIDSRVSILDIVLLVIEIMLTSLPLKLYFTGTDTDKVPSPPRIPDPERIVNKMSLGSITINPRLLFQVFGAITVSALALALIFRIYTYVRLWETGERERGNI